MSRVVSDKIKKRLSMRYADDVNPAHYSTPAVPIIPSAYASAQTHRSQHPGPGEGAMARRRPTLDANATGSASMWGQDQGSDLGGDQPSEYNSGLDMGSLRLAGFDGRKVGTVADERIERSDRKTGSITLDLTLLGKEGFDAEACECDRIPNIVWRIA